MLNRRLFLIVAGLLIFAADGLAGDKIYTGFFSNDAVGGYDTVAYFTLGKPTKGSGDFKLQYNGATWYFSSKENLDRFKSDPDKFAPQYGGYCAWAVADNTTAEGDPDHWTIHNNKLYLNYNGFIKRQWLENIDANIAKANVNWPGVIE